jgi:hypothetical protein
MDGMEMKNAWPGCFVLVGVMADFLKHRWQRTPPLSAASGLTANIYHVLSNFSPSMPVLYPTTTRSPTSSVLARLHLLPLLPS